MSGWRNIGSAGASPSRFAANPRGIRADAKGTVGKTQYAWNGA
jgi:hypothetical protein